MTHKHHKPEHTESEAPMPVSPAGEPVQPQATAPQTPVSETDALRTERDDLLGRLQRVSADFMNYQKRVQKDIAQSREFANDELLKAMLVVLDDIDLAISAAQGSHAADDPLLVGVNLVRDKALDVFGRFGMTVIVVAPGDNFDHAMHSAVLQQPSGQPAMTIIQEARKGYQLRGRVLRPSSVVVSSGPAEAQQQAEKEV